MVRSYQPSRAHAYIRTTCGLYQSSLSLRSFEPPPYDIYDLQFYFPYQHAFSPLTIFQSFFFSRQRRESANARAIVEIFPTTNYLFGCVCSSLRICSTYDTYVRRSPKLHVARGFRKLLRRSSIGDEIIVPPTQNMQPQGTRLLCPLPKIISLGGQAYCVPYPK